MSVGLPKCFSYLQSKGFISLNSKAVRIKELDTFGIIVKANLKRCLNDYNRLIDKFTVFPVSRVGSISNLNNHLLCGKKLDKYAVSFDSSDLIEPISEPNNELSLWSSKSCLKNLIIFCDPNKSLNLFYSFQNERYRWWRKLSGCPSHFHQSQIGKCSITQEENVSIDFKSPLVDDKTLCLETIKYITDRDQIKNSIGVESSSHIIWCKTFPDNATISYLIDGCITDDEGKFKEIWFHESLTPYHVAITIKPSQDSNLNSKLVAIADFLIKELKEFGITVFPFKNQNDTLDDKSFQWFDQIGIPYSISITEESLRLGVIGLRNKDTKLEEEVHVTRVKINLLLYLKLMKPFDIKLAIMESNKDKASKASTIEVEESKD